MDRRAAFVFGICAAPRLLALAMFTPGVSTYYDELATGLLTTGTFGFNGVPSTYIEPLYPAFLAAARTITGNSLPLVLALQIAIASIGGVLLYRLGSRLAGPSIGLCAGVLYALYPYLVRQSVARLEITLCTTLAIAATLSLTRTADARGAIASGAWLGLLMLTRTSFVVAAMAAAFWLAWRGRGRLAAAMLLTALLVEAPWLVRNARVDGSPLPSRIGENLYLSTSTYAAVVPAHDIDLLVPLALADVREEVERLHLPPSAEERAMDDAMLTRAAGFIRERPGRVLWLKARNVLYLLSPQLLPRDAKSPAAFATVDGDTVRIVNAARRPWIEDAAHAVAQGLLLLLAAIGIARRGVEGTDAPLIIMLAAQAAVCTVFFPTTRLMAPVMFVVMFYAAVGLEDSLALRYQRLTSKANAYFSHIVKPTRRMPAVAATRKDASEYSLNRTVASVASPA
jgi:4-amino-4-deoxy-L-arabinose transferase-like glycosyltransferase